MFGTDDGGKTLELWKVVVSVWRYWNGRVWLSECFGKVLQAGGNDVSGSCYWHGASSGEPRECVGNAFGSGIFCNDAVAAVVLHGRANVPSIFSVWCMRLALVCFYMNDDFGAWRSHWSAVEIKRAK